ncbi:MAG: hypothetical protein ACM3QX_18255 [Syntrophomonadaceae bacterium]
MTVSEAIVRLRTYLDEAGISDGFYKDTTELMTALNDGVREVVKIIFSIYRSKRVVNGMEKLPEVLQRYMSSNSIPVMYTPQMPMPADCMYIVGASYSVNGNNLKPCYERSLSERDPFDQANSFLAATADAPYFYVRFGSIWFEPGITGSGACEVLYLRRPASASAVTDSLDTIEAAHNAVIQFAYSAVLRKDLRTQESLEEYQKFLGMTQQLYM